MNTLEAKITTNNSNIIFGQDNLNKNIETDSKVVNKKGMQDIKEQKLSQNQKINIKNSNNLISKSQNNLENMNFKADTTPISLLPNQKSATNQLNPKIFQNKKGEFEQTQKYINYLKTHLDSSYYAFNEIKNKNSILLSKSKFINDEIKKSNIIYQKLLKLIESKEKENIEYKAKYEKILEERKTNKDKIMNLELDEKIEKMKEKNIILIKENESKEEIIMNLKKTLEVLEKNKKEKYKEKEERLNELIKEKKSIDKLKQEFDEIGKELIDKNNELEETKKTIINLLTKKEEDYKLLNKLNNKENI